MLGGSINVQSQLGRGTTVEVTVPMTRPLSGARSVNNTPQSGGTSTSGSSAGEETINLLQNQASDCGVAIYSPSQTQGNDIVRVFSNYIKEWYSMPLIPQDKLDTAAVVIVDEQYLQPFLASVKEGSDMCPALIVLCSVTSRHSEDFLLSLEKRVRNAVELATKPCGPYKLAKSILSILEKSSSSRPRTQLNGRPLDVITEQPTPFDPPTETSKISDDLQQMDLSGPEHYGVDQVVEASETLAASSSSQNAQMALRSPTTAVCSPGPREATEGFPFPTQHADTPTSTNDIMTPMTNRSTDDEETPVQSIEIKPPKDTRSNKKESQPAVIPNMLLVDDNQINLTLLRTYMERKRKYNRFTMAENGSLAVEAFKASPKPIEIIFMDISMPVMNGFEATRAIRDYEESQGIQQGAMVIALTGLASGHHQSEGFDAGCDIYMTKPVSFKDVGKLLDNWEAHKRLSLAGVRSGVQVPDMEKSAVRKAMI